jgi:predicted ATPase
MVEAYKDCGYEVVELPKTSPAMRADFIVSLLPG